MSTVGRYKTVQAETASPERLMMLLFERALAHMKSAQEAFAAGEESLAPRIALTKAAEIVCELNRTLDVEAAGALGETLKGVYDFVQEKVTVAALEGDADALAEAARVFEPVVEAFREATGEAAAARPSGTGPVR
ncbi:MAG: flagellar protein FliS [Deltaproteobacteria bacterium]|nr:MAG: flagellar protein FliS [Deltaproteobacteria bacterium]